MKTLAIYLITLLCSLTPASVHSQRNAAGDRERLIGAWHLVRINTGESAAQSATAPEPLGILVYTQDGHMSVQLMYPESTYALDNKYVRAGYEASFGSYDVNEAKHTLTHHVQGSITRNLLVGRNLPRKYQLTQDGYLIISSADPNENWSVTWEHY